MSVDTDRRWELRTASVRGVRHLQTGAPNQDAVAWYRSPDGQRAAVCVGDGHGSVSSFRSDVGAALAVEVTLERLRRFSEEFAGRELPAVQAAAQELPAQLLADWERAVGEHRSANRISRAELKRSGQRTEIADDELPIVYGTTLLAACATPDFVLFSQLGDGDILCRRDGHVVRPLGAPAEQYGNDTVSLASGRLALREWRLVVEPADPPPDLILLSTDGYSNSFRDQAGFTHAATEIEEWAREHGLDWVAANLPAWLRASSTRSGDDITVGLLFPVDARRGVAPTASGVPARTQTRRRMRGLIGVAVLMLLVGAAIGFVAGWALSPWLPETPLPGAATPGATLATASPGTPMTTTPTTVTPSPGQP